MFRPQFQDQASLAPSTHNLLNLKSRAPPCLRHRTLYISSLSQAQLHPHRDTGFLRQPCPVKKYLVSFSVYRSNRRYLIFNMDDSSSYVFRFNPLGLDNMEDLERYEPGGFHPVHLDDYYDDNRYRIVHKLGAGGFSTVWLARDLLGQQWVGLKFITAADSENYNNRSSAIIADPTLASSEFLVSPEREFWVDGPNGRHLCFVLPFVGPNLGTLSSGIYARISSRLSASLSLQAAQAMALLHSRERCHGGMYQLLSYIQQLRAECGPRY